MTFSISARDSNIKPDSEAGGLIPGTIWKISCYNLFIIKLTHFKILEQSLNTWNRIISSNLYMNRTFHSNVNVMGRFYTHFLTSLYRSTYLFETRLETKIFASAPSFLVLWEYCADTEVEFGRKFRICPEGK
jgi:hypothetical protein